MRRALAKDFSNIFIFNLRGSTKNFAPFELNQNNEGDNVFNNKDSVAICFFIKDNVSTFISEPKQTAQIHYLEFTDKLTSEEKLKKVEKYKSWKSLFDSASTRTIDSQSAWIRQDKTEFYNHHYFLPLRQEKILNPNYDKNERPRLPKRIDAFLHPIFQKSSSGVGTNRDPWCWNYSSQKLKNNLSILVNYYNKARKAFILAKSENNDISFRNDCLNDYSDSKQISWSADLRNYAEKDRSITLNNNHITAALFYPFVKKKLYFDKYLNERRGKLAQLFYDDKNHFQPCRGFITAYKNNNFSLLAVNQIFNSNIFITATFFPLDQHQTNSLKQKGQKELFSKQQKSYINQEIIQLFKYQNKTVTATDIFYYIYGLLHSKDYQSCFSNALSTALPRIPKFKDYYLFDQFKTAGKKLANWHWNYESHQYQNLYGYNKSNDPSHYLITNKIRFKAATDKNPTCSIRYNENITLKGIPSRIIDWKIDGICPVEQICKGYWNKTDKKSNSEIVHLVNDYLKETKPSYIVDLILKLIDISLKTVDIVNELPKINFNDMELFEKIK